jgi:TPR repeat protein
MIPARFTRSDCQGVDASSLFETVLRCADQGHAFAQFSLGFMYVLGEGVPEDLVLAYMWYNLSAAQGDEGAQDNKELIVPDMTREQIGEAQWMSREWLEAHR